MGFSNYYPFQRKLKDLIGIETKPTEDIEDVVFTYKPSDWYDRDPASRPNRVIRFGGGTRTCVFPAPSDGRYMPSYLEYMREFIEKRQETTNSRALGSVAINPEI